MGGEITAQQDEFAKQYPVDFNGQEAAKRAKYSPKSAHVTASRLLKNVKVQAAIARYSKKALDEAELTQEDVIQGILKIARFNLADCYDENDQLLPISKMPEHALMGLKSIETAAINRGGRHIGVSQKVTRQDSLKAWELLGKRFKLFSEQIDINASGEINININTAAGGVPGSQSQRGAMPAEVVERLMVASGNGNGHSNGN